MTSYFVTSYNAELMERAALIEWLHFHRLFQDFFVFSTIKLHCMGDLPKYWVDRIKWLGYATNASQLVSCIQVSIAIAANLIASYASTGHGSLLASQSALCKLQHTIE